LMSVVKRIVKDGIERVKVDELLADEYEQAGYGGITLTKTPLGTQINLFAMRPGRVIGKRGRAIKDASERLEQELGIPNPQITVVEVEFPELNPRIMAARIANALERGVHYRRAIFWSLNRIMEAGAIGCEIVLNGPLRSNRGRFEKISEGYVPKAGDSVLKYVKTATMHVKMKKGVIGVNVTIVPPDAKFPDKVDLGGLPVIEYPEEEYKLPEGVEPEPPEIPEIGEATTTEETSTKETAEEPVSIEELKVEASPEDDQPDQEEIRLQKQVKAKAETVEGEEINASAEPTEGDEDTKKAEED
jgi:small subunit ribosomal protein S3